MSGSLRIGHSFNRGRPAWSCLKKPRVRSNGGSQAPVHFNSNSTNSTRVAPVLRTERSAPASCQTKSPVLRSMSWVGKASSQNTTQPIRTSSSKCDRSKRSGEGYSRLFTCSLGSRRSPLSRARKKGLQRDQKETNSRDRASAIDRRAARRRRWLFDEDNWKHRHLFA